MDRNPRHQRRISIGLERLDERLAPSNLGAFAAIAQQHRAAVQERAALAAARRETLHANRLAAARTPFRFAAGAGQASTGFQIAGRHAASGAVAHPARAFAINHPGAFRAANRAISAPAILPTTTTPQMNTSPAMTAATPDPSTLAKAGPMLTQVYQEYQSYLASGDTKPFTSSLSGMIRIQGDKVGVDLQATGDFDNFVGSLKGLGMQIEATAASSLMVEGLLPIASIPGATSLPQLSSISPIYSPMTM